MDIRQQLRLRLQAANLLVSARSADSALEEADLTQQARRITLLANAQAVAGAPALPLGEFRNWRAAGSE